MITDPRKIAQAQRSLSDPRYRSTMSQDEIKEAEEMVKKYEQYSDNLDKTANLVHDVGEDGNTLVDTILDVLGIFMPGADAVSIGKKYVEGDKKGALTSAATSFVPLPTVMKTGVSDALSTASRRFGVEGSVRRGITNFGQEYAERTAIGSALGSLKNGGKIRRMDPKMLLAQKMILKGNK